MDHRGMVHMALYMYFRELIELGRMVSGWKQVTVNLVSDDSTYLKIPNGFIEFVL